MSDVPRLVSGAEREARREVLQEALERLASSPDPHGCAQDVLRALDVYLDAHPGATSSLREPPVTDFSRSARPPATRRDVSPALWVVLGAAVAATIVVAFALSGGWPAGVAVIGIWVVALLVLTQTS
jgi:hypothetical protein